MKTFVLCLFAISGLVFPSIAHADGISDVDLKRWEAERRAEERWAEEFAAKKCQPGEEYLVCGLKPARSFVQKKRGRLSVSVAKEIPFVEKCPSLEDLRYYELKRRPVTRYILDPLGTRDWSTRKASPKTFLVGHEIYLCKRTPEGVILAQADAKEAEIKRIEQEKARLEQERRELMKRGMRWAGILAAIGLGGYLIWRLRRRSVAAPPTGSDG